MNKQTQIAIWLSITVGLISSAAADPLNGTVSSVDGQGDARIVHFRAATQDLDLSLKSLSDADQALVLSPKARTSRIELNVPSNAIQTKTDVPMGIRPYCSELPVSI